MHHFVKKPAEYEWAWQKTANFKHEEYSECNCLIAMSELQNTKKNIKFETQMYGPSWVYMNAIPWAKPTYRSIN